MNTHSFTAVTPPARFDGVPWTTVSVEESALAAGPFTLVATLAVEVDATPDTPNPVNITVTTATLASGFFRFRFADIVGNTSPYSSPVASPALSPSLPVRPTAQAVADLCGAYTRQAITGGYPPPGGEPQAGRELGEFTASTSPTLNQVEGFITAAVDEVRGRVGIGELPEDVWDLARTTALYHAAAAVQAMRAPAGTDDSDGLYAAFISNYRASLIELIQQARPRVLPGMY